MTDKTDKERLLDLETVVRQLEAENKNLREALDPSSPFREVLSHLLATFEGYQMEQAARSFFLQTIEERKSRLQTIISLSSELVKIREVTDVGTRIGESIITAVIEGRWIDALKEADEDLVFKDGQTNDLWAWFRSTALTSGIQARDRAEGITREQN